MRRRNNAIPTHASKLISFWLRHQPQQAGLHLDAYGWADIQQLLHALADRDLHFTLQELVALNTATDKVRWEIDPGAGKIRATHGHSVPVAMNAAPACPPQVLYHGTAIQTIPQIREQGLLPMGRQFVHLSETKDAAMAVGRRHGQPYIIQVNTWELVKAGQPFYRTAHQVWLTAAIPAAHLTFEKGG